MIKEIKVNNLVHPFRHIFVYQEEDVLGKIEIDIIYEKSELVDLFVNEAKRGEKIGTKLLNHAIEYAKNKGCQNMTLEVKEDNIIAIHLYENLGFKQVAIREGYYKGIDGILMELIM